MQEKETRIFRLSGRIDEELFKRFDAFCEKATKDGVIMVVIPMMSRGGDLGWASKFVDKMKNSPFGFTTIAHNYVYSAAIPIFASGGLRISTNQKDLFLFHEAKVKKCSWVSFGKKISQDSVLRYISYVTETSLEKIKSFVREGKYLSGVEAKEIGLVNKLR